MTLIITKEIHSELPKGEAKQRPAFKAEIIWRLVAREVFVARQAERLLFNAYVPDWLPS